MLHTQGIVDVGVLPSCTSLTSLNLAFNQLQNIAGLSGLTGLTSLNLAHNQIASLKVWIIWMHACRRRGPVFFTVTDLPVARSLTCPVTDLPVAR